MLLPGYPDGVPPIDVIEDIRYSVRNKDVHAKARWLMEEYKRRALTPEEVKWARDTARHNLARIRETHQAQDAVRVTDAKTRMGTKKFNEVQQSAEKQTRLRRLQALKKAETELEAAEKASQDFGI